MDTLAGRMARRSIAAASSLRRPSPLAREDGEGGGARRATGGEGGTLEHGVFSPAGDDWEETCCLFPSFHANHMVPRGSTGGDKARQRPTGERDVSIVDGLRRPLWGASIIG